MATTEAKDTTIRREYVVLMQTITGDDEPAWLQVGTADAATREDALETVVDTLPADEQEGTFVAVAARHWVKTRAEVQVKRTRRWT